MTRKVSAAYDTERAQAGVRMIFVAVAGCYTAALYHFSLIDPALVWKVFLLKGLFCVVATLIWTDILRRPGHYRGRRLFTMLTDYTGITVALANGGAAMLPVYAILIWVTIGYGLRYGSGYLLLATVMALLSLTVTASTSPYWQSQPYLILTLLLTTIMAPAYMHALLKRSRQAAEAEQAAIRARSEERV